MVRFISDRGGVFDEMTFASEAEAIAALERNDFRCFADSRDLQSFLSPQEPPFHPGSHPSGPI